MKHYSVEQWVDLVRGVASPDAGLAMRQHLSEGCADCAATATRLRFAAETLSGDASRPVPESVIRRARAVFQPTRRPSLVQVIADLLFDSWTQPALAGVRSTADATRQLSYRAGELRVDLSIDAVPRMAKVLLTGQLRPERGEAGRFLVRAMSGSRALAETVTNEFGEFSLEAPASAQLSLHLEDTPGGLGVVLPLAHIITKPGKRPLNS